MDNIGLFTKVKLLGTLLITVILINGCGGGSGDNNSTSADITDNFSFENTVKDTFNPRPYAEDEISTDPAGRRILRTSLQIVFTSDATSEQVKNLLDSLSATVSSSLEGIPAVVINIPDPGSLVSLDGLVSAIEANNFVWFVRKSISPKTNELPSDVTVSDSNYVKHHLAVKAHNVWAIRDIINNSPNVAVLDRFGGGSPNADLSYFSAYPDMFSDRSIPLPDNCFLTPDRDDCVSSHGYHVTGIISGQFGSENYKRLRETVTGIFPNAVKLAVYDLNKNPAIHILDWEQKLLLDLKGYQG